VAVGAGLQRTEPERLWVPPPCLGLCRRAPSAALVGVEARAQDSSVPTCCRATSRTRSVQSPPAGSPRSGADAGAVVSSKVALRSFALAPCRLCSTAVTADGDTSSTTRSPGNGWAIDTSTRVACTLPSAGIEIVSSTPRWAASGTMSTATSSAVTTPFLGAERRTCVPPLASAPGCRGRF
jgi:hypothetical protein